MEDFKKLIKDLLACWAIFLYIGAGAYQIKHGFDLLKDYELCEEED